MNTNPLSRRDHFAGIAFDAFLHRKNINIGNVNYVRDSARCAALAADIMIESMQEQAIIRQDKERRESIEIALSCPICNGSVANTHNICKMPPKVYDMLCGLHKAQSMPPPSEAETVF